MRSVFSGLGLKTERSCPLLRLFHQLLISVAIEGAGITDFATIDDEAQYSGLCH
jgi:hypothetical protein